MCMPGITTSIDLFEHDKRMVFLYDDLLGRISTSDEKNFTAEPLKGKKITLSSELEAIKYLMEGSTGKVLMQVEQTSKLQMALF